MKYLLYYIAKYPYIHKSLCPTVKSHKHQNYDWKPAIQNFFQRLINCWDNLSSQQPFVSLSARRKTKKTFRPYVTNKVTSKQTDYFSQASTIWKCACHYEYSKIPLFCWKVPVYWHYSKCAWQIMRFDCNCDCTP